jgi:hypothetical protein
METKERFCDICAFQHINELAVEWCSECDEALCSKCKEQHGIAKATRNHTPCTISMTNSCTFHTTQLLMITAIKVYLFVVIVACLFQGQNGGWQLC